MTRSSLPRRRFLAASALGLASTSLINSAHGETRPQPDLPSPGNFPVKAVSSANGLAATKKAYELIVQGEDPLQAVVSGVAIVEADPKDTSVGYGGLPNEEGVVELDAAVMHGPTHRAGSVAALRNIKHPAQVAMKVMEITDHELLVGEGALRFARATGFKEENLLTDVARRIWLRWKRNHSNSDDWLSTEQADSQVEAFFREHSVPVLVADRIVHQFRRPTGTIHCSAMNAQGDISCTTTTSGLAFKIPGRVGDSPIIGSRPLLRQ
jgi:N4-(beta-N-acetylglucosaminyl)-L-asparaginase